MTTTTTTTAYTATYTYWKSTYTDQIYKMPGDWMPKFGGWEPVHEETYLAYAKEHGLL